MKVDKRSNKRKLKQATALLPADVPSVAERGHGGRATRYCRRGVFPGREARVCTGR